LNPMFSEAQSTFNSSVKPTDQKKHIPYFPAYSAHPKLFCIPFEVQMTRT
jgi:hypothetical protein